MSGRPCLRHNQATTVPPPKKRILLLQLPMCKKGVSKMNKFPILYLAFCSAPKETASLSQDNKGKVRYIDQKVSLSWSSYQAPKIRYHIALHLPGLLSAFHTTSLNQVCDLVDLGEAVLEGSSSGVGSSGVGSAGRGRQDG